MEFDYSYEPPEDVPVLVSEMTQEQLDAIEEAFDENDYDYLPVPESSNIE